MTTSKSTKTDEKDLHQMKCLVVKAHPLAESLCSSLTELTVQTLRVAGHSVEVEDLYEKRFDASLTEEERRSYYDGAYASHQVAAQIQIFCVSQQGIISV